MELQCEFPGDILGVGLAFIPLMTTTNATAAKIVCCIAVLLWEQ
jgi:hypothetical protein